MKSRYLNVDAAIRLAILRAARRPVDSADLPAVIDRDTGYVVSTKSAANMAARLHRAGWLTYTYGDHWPSQHLITDAGEDVLGLVALDPSVVHAGGGR